MRKMVPTLELMNVLQKEDIIPLLCESQSTEGDVEDVLIFVKCGMVHEARSFYNQAEWDLESRPIISGIRRPPHQRKFFIIFDGALVQRVA